MPDYETLRLTWWLLLGLLLAGFAVADGYDLGIAALLRTLGHDDDERRVLLETIEPTWEGSQTWLIVGAGAMFAAWPLVYAAVFSGFYFAMLLALLALILRPVGFNFRNKISDPRWRTSWDWALVLSGVLPTLVFGIAFGNLFLGVPLRYDDTLRVIWQGGFLDLLHPFALLAGSIALVLVLLHGCTWLGVKADERIAARATRLLAWLAPIYAALFLAAGAWLASGIPGQQIVGSLATEAPSNPLAKSVAASASWLHGPLGRESMAAAAVALFAALAAPWLVRRRAYLSGFIASSLAIAGTVFAAGFALFPFLLPSSLEARSGLTIWDASSSQTTLGLMLLASVVFLPLVLAYTAWVHRVLRGRVTLEHVRKSHGMY